MIFCSTVLQCDKLISKMTEYVISGLISKLTIAAFMILMSYKRSRLLFRVHHTAGQRIIYSATAPSDCLKICLQTNSR